MRHNHRLAAWTQRLLCARFGVEPHSPRDGRLLGSMATVRLPDALQPERGAAGTRGFPTFEALQQTLYDRFRVEVPVVPWGGEWHIRPCCQAYNAPRQYERTADAIEALAALARHDENTA
jgi:isopenicillin-N epimerase